LNRVPFRATPQDMKQVFDLDDRARLRERFYGAMHSVLAFL
jgi:hypothetical protein